MNNVLLVADHRADEMLGCDGTIACSWASLLPHLF